MSRISPGERVLDRVESRPHPRMAEFRAAPLVANKPPRSYNWACDVHLDQGREGACVGFGWTHEAMARPVVWKGLAEANAFDLYHWAKRNDAWGGEDYEGTSVDAGAKGAREFGYIGSWYWARTTEEVILCLGYKGPVVFGLDWWTGMFDPDANGFLHLTGRVEGGHCILGVGVKLVWRPGTTAEEKRRDDWINFLDLDLSYVTLWNSWGPDWGQNGSARLSIRDLQSLMANGGECAVPQDRRRAPVSRKA